MSKGIKRWRWVLVGVVLTALAWPSGALGFDNPEREFRETLRDDTPTKSLVIPCENGKYAVGGGVEIDDGFRDRVRLTSSYSLAYGGYFVAAEAANHTRSFDWKLTGFAICVDVESDDHFTVADQTYLTLDRFMAGASKPCPAGTIAYSAGARVTSPSFGTTNGLIGLQLLRTDRPMTIGRATARADIAEPTYRGGWRMNVSAVCMRGQGGARIAAAGLDPRNPRLATVSCSPDTIVGVGGGVSAPGFTDPGRTWLKALSPISAGLKTSLVEVTAPLAGGPIAWNTCVERDPV
jgi:hypothetical protein